MTVSVAQGNPKLPCVGILLVEDDDAIREALRYALEYEGYDVSSASNGQDALDKLKTLPRPCLVLLDLMMPVMNGWELAENLSKDAVLSTIPVVIVTAFSEKVGELAKTHRILKKPMGIDLLLSVAHEYCGQPPQALGKPPLRPVEL